MPMNAWSSAWPSARSRWSEPCSHWSAQEEIVQTEKLASQGRGDNGLGMNIIHGIVTSILGGLNRQRIDVHGQADQALANGLLSGGMQHGLPGTQKLFAHGGRDLG